MASFTLDIDARPAGYAALADRYALRVIRNRHRSRVSEAKIYRTQIEGLFVDEIYPSSFWPGDSLGDHLEFALKYDGVNLAFLDLLFQQPVEEELLSYIQSKPTGRYARRLWFLYEFLTGRLLPLDDITQGNYVDLLNPEDYCTLGTPRRVKRQRINDNLLGDRRFCPIIRRTEAIRAFQAAELGDRCRDVVAGYSGQVIRRALGYLYTRETKSSFAIEHEDISPDRVARFLTLLERAEEEDFCEREPLITLQNRIVPGPFQENEFRTTQNYVGETIYWNKQRIHYVSPKPEDVEALVDGLIAAHQRIESGGLSPVVHAAAIAYGFVFIHPFEDGNGRIHRFLIHNILARRGFTPDDLIFPVSAAMLRGRQAYDESLEAFSRQLTPLIDYSQDDEGRLTVHNDTARWYRYIDLTAQAEALFRFIESTIDTELPQELAFIASYDETKRAIQDIVDMPDRKIDTFVQCCLRNNGRLSARKRELFSMLTDDEIARLEEAVRTGYGSDRVREALAAYRADSDY